MIEAIVRGYLGESLAVPVYVQKNANAETKFVTIERTGGGMENHIRSAMIAVQSYAPTMYEAAELHEEVMALMLEITDRDDIGGISLNSEYNFTDEETDLYRYQAVFDIVYYD